MDNKKFETLLKEDRNWLSKYGGFISLVIIVLLILGVFLIKIPEYGYVQFSKNNVPFIEINNEYFIGNIGDSINIDNPLINDGVLIIDKIKTEKEVIIISFKPTNKNLSSKNLRIISNEKTLLKSLLNPLLPKKVQ
jgi:hypothetical protein